MGQVSDNDWLFWHKQANGCGLKPTMSSLWSKVRHTHRDMVSCLFFPPQTKSPWAVLLIYLFLFFSRAVDQFLTQTGLCLFICDSLSLSAFFSSSFYKNSCAFHSCISRPWSWIHIRECVKQLYLKYNASWINVSVNVYVSIFVPVLVRTIRKDFQFLSSVDSAPILLPRDLDMLYVQFSSN